MIKPYYYAFAIWQKPVIEKYYAAMPQFFSIFWVIFDTLQKWDGTQIAWFNAYPMASLLPTGYLKRLLKQKSNSKS